VICAAVLLLLGFSSQPAVPILVTQGVCWRKVLF